MVCTVGNGEKLCESTGVADPDLKESRGVITLSGSSSTEFAFTRWFSLEGVLSWTDFNKKQASDWQRAYILREVVTRRDTDLLGPAALSSERSRLRLAVKRTLK